NIVRKTDGNTQRVSLDGSWKKKMIHKSGNLLNFDINLRGDLYRTTKKYIPNNSSRLLPSNRFGDEISIARFLPSFSVDWSYPVISPNGRTIIEPTISLTMATNDKEYLKIPNEDSLAFELSSSNIFDNNRIQGFDRWEYGNRFNYGLKISHYWNERVIKAMIGQSYRFSNLSFAYTGSGIRKDFSDIIFDLLYKPNKKIVISYRGRVSEEDLGLVRSEFDVQGNFKKWGFRLGHAHLDNEENINLKEQKELRFANFININKNWLIQGAVRYDIESKKSLRNRLSVVYIDDCISFELGFRRKFAEYRDLKPSNSFMVKLNVYTFGGGNINNTQRLTKLWERVE
ncbi:MAG: LPS assembly protein LptD, partial [Pseudomonadota bacterium]|nr:LPS assembly protein LptD [Pseudomonadota bacterium]